MELAPIAHLLVEGANVFPTAHLQAIVVGRLASASWPHQHKAVAQDGDVIQLRRVRKRKVGFPPLSQWSTARHFKKCCSNLQ